MKGDCFHFIDYFFYIIVIKALTKSMGDCVSISFSTLLGKLSFSA